MYRANPFDNISLDGLASLNGFGSKLKKALKKITRSVAKFKEKSEAIHDKAPFMKKTGGRLRDKLEAQPLFRKGVAAVATYYGGPAAGAGATMLLEEQQKIKAENRIKLENEAFFKTDAGKEFLANKQKFAAAIAEMQATPEFKAAYDRMKADGYTDEQIAAAWLSSKPAQTVATIATADVIYPIAKQQAERMGVPYPDVMAADVSMGIAESAVKKQDQTKSSLVPLAITAGLILLAGGG